MPKDELLPGVTTTSCPPPVLCDARGAVRAARRRAWVREGLQLTMLLAVDWLFVRWPESRVPLLDRNASLTLLRAANFGILGHLWLVRALPKWTARRIASTWSRAERERFRAEPPKAVTSPAPAARARTSAAAR